MTLRMRLASVFPLLMVAALAVAACGGTASPTGVPNASAASDATASAPPATPAAPTPAFTPTGTPAPTPGPTATPDTGPGVAATPAGFACSYPFDQSSSRSGMAAVSDVRVGAHADYDRIVFEFVGTGVSGVRLERAQPPLMKDPSGLPLAVPGTSFVRIVLVQASGAGYAQPDGKATYVGPTSFRLGGSGLVSLVQQGDFEGTSSWIAGLAGPMCYSVSTLAGPARLAIDFRAP